MMVPMSLTTESAPKGVPTMDQAAIAPKHRPWTVLGAVGCVGGLRLIRSQPGRMVLRSGVVAVG